MIVSIKVQGDKEPLDMKLDIDDKCIAISRAPNDFICKEVSHMLLAGLRMSQTNMKGVCGTCAGTGSTRCINIEAEDSYNVDCQSCKGTGIIADVIDLDTGKIRTTND